MKLLLTERDIDVLCVSETWLLPSIPDDFVNISMYRMFRCDNGRGGGVCVYVKNSLCTNVIKLDIPRVDGVEDVWVTVQCRKLPAIIVGCVYRHPKALVTSYDYIEEVFKMICLRNKKVFILGDFNDNILDKGNKLSKIIKTNNLTQMIEVPTRTTSTSATLLDLIITNEPQVVLSHDVVPQVIADHDLISAVINIRKPRKPTVIKTVRDFRNYDKDVFCSLLFNNIHIMNNVFFTDNVDHQVRIFNEYFLECVDMCAPKVTKVIKGRPTPWMNDEVRSAITARNVLQDKLKKDVNNCILREQYKTAKKHVKFLINKTRSDHYCNRLSDSKGNSSATWKIIGEIVPNQKHKSSPCNFDDPGEKADEFSDFFSKVGERTYERSQEQLKDKDYVLPEHNYYTTDTDSAFRPKTVDINTVILTIKSLNSTTSVGSDDISLQFLKDGLGMIISHLTCIINTSIVTGKFPSAWKHALVVPLFKNGDPNCVSNYRPISLLPIISKVLEKIVANQLSHYLESNKLLSDCQHGFRPKLCTETALTVITDKLYSNIDNKYVSLLTLLDLSKAFDSVDINILLNKCAKFNVDEFWFNSYLRKRTMSVRLANNVSTMQNVDYGVPQGSVLGPILFGMYVNDLSDHVNCFLVQYADDTQLLHTGTLNNVDELIRNTEDSLKKCRHYFLKNGLMLNSAKTQCIFIGNRQILSRIPPNTTINFNGNIIYPSTHVKNLGVFMDRHMVFDVHITELIKKVNGILMYINRIGDLFDKETRVVVVQSIALSLIEYCIRIWGTTNETLLKKVQKMQNFAAKVAIGGAKKYDHVSPILTELQWLKIKQKHEFLNCTTMYKILRGFYPEWLFTHSFKTVQEVTNNITRQNNKLYVPRSRTQTGERRLAVLAAKLWNELPTHVTQATSLSSFKHKLKKSYLSEDV